MRADKRARAMSLIRAIDSIARRNGMKKPAVPKLKKPKRPQSKKTSGLTANEARRQAIEPDVKSTDALGTGPVANPKCELPESIRIVVVDDHPLFRHGLIQLLNSDDGFSVCGE